jgi:chaperonin GroES
MVTMDFSVKLARELILRSNNLASDLPKQDADQIFADCMDGYRRDVASRKQWEDRYANAMNLAMQVAEKKTFPWPDCANVKFPLITVAALQYQAKAYPALVDGRTVYQGHIEGRDDDGKATEIAERVGSHMSWQCLVQDQSWEEETDKLLLVQAICGCAFRKTWFDPIAQRLCSKLVMPADLVANYYTRGLDTSPRYTHRFFFSRNDIRQRVLSGLYTDQAITDASIGENSQDETTEAQDQRQGVTQPEQEKITPYLIGEQYCWYDLDGDGFDEPYTVTLDLNTGQGWRIAARFLPSGVRMKDGRVTAIEPVRFFVKYPFIPAPDNGFYDLGLGALVGPINDSVNGAINQLFDAGTMATLGGGFVGRGFKQRGGPFTFRPHMWQPTDAPGDDLRKNVLPLPVKEPSNVLFQLVGFLVQYAERIVSATEIQVGESPGQNMKAGTAEILNQNGSRVYTAIYKRTWRSIRDDGLIRYMNNRLFIEADVDFSDLTTGTGITVKPGDYNLSKVVITPAADPHIVSDTERRDQALMIMKNAFTLPGHNRYKAMLRVYKSMKVPNIGEILEPPMQQGKNGQPEPAKDYPQPPNPKMMDVQIKAAAQKLRETEFHVEQGEKKIRIQAFVQKNQAEITKLYAQSEKLVAEAKGVETGHMIELINARISALKGSNDQMLQLIDMVGRYMPIPGDPSEEGGEGRGPVPPAGPGQTSAPGGQPQLPAPSGNGAAMPQ